MTAAAPVGEAPGLSIQLLGGFCVTIGSRIVHESEWCLRKTKNVIKLLALAPQHRLHREQMMDRLWPDMEPEAAANNLYKALHIARRALEPALSRYATSSYLHLRQECIILDPPGRLWVDAEAFLAAATAAQRTQDPTAHEAALSLYRGDLLPEDRYEDWAVRHREELRAVRFGLLMDLAAMRERRSEVHAAIAALRHVVRDDPAHEEAQGILIRLLAQTGQRYLALRQYQHLCDALQRELNAEPDPGIQALHRLIHSGHQVSKPHALLPSLSATEP
jgi:DNA-binding SARP family transcriptional activator